MKIYKGKQIRIINRLPTNKKKMQLDLNKKCYLFDFYRHNLQK